MPQLTWITHSNTRDNNDEARKTIFAPASGGKCSIKTKAY